MVSKNLEIRDVLNSNEWLSIVYNMSDIQDAVGVEPRYHDWRCAKYDEMLQKERLVTDPLMESHLEFWRNWEYVYLYQNLYIRTGMSVCDVGCGNSPLLAWLKKYHNCKVLGIETLDRIQNEENPFGIPGRRYHEAYTKQFGVDYLDVEGGIFNWLEILPYKETFDRVVSIGVLEHIEFGQLAFIMHMKKLCKPNGLIGITYDVRSDSDPVKVNEMVEDAGLEIVNPDYSYPGDTMPFCQTIRGMILRRKNENSTDKSTLGS